jgi:two-component system OmpR family response regulator
MRILVAEDDPSVSEHLLVALRQAAHEPQLAATGTDADARLESAEFDLVLLDLGLPGLSGLEVLKRLRSREARLSKNRTPVLILTAQDQVDARVQGLDAGADDYLAKPFEIAELQARVRALARRGGTATVLELGALTFDPLSRAARLRGEKLELSGREADLLEALMRRPGKLVTRDHLASQLATGSAEGASGAIDVYVKRLSKKLEAGGLRIVTVPGVGYSLDK